MPSLYMTTKEICLALQVSDARAVKRFLSSKGVYPIHIGRLLRWHRESVMSALASMHQPDTVPTPKPKRKKTESVLNMSARELFQKVCTETVQ